MDANTQTKQNIRQTVPFFMVSDMENSLNFYVKGLGFEIENKWTPRGNIEWCWLKRDGGVLMLQEYHKAQPHAIKTGNKLGEGVSIWFQCEDALELYIEFMSNGLNPSEPFVGNNMWDVKIKDPDGYVLHFESPTDVREETTYSQWKNEL
jgi:lactoylglutathione lyase